LDLASILRKSAVHFGDRTAVEDAGVDAGGDQTYDRLWRRSCQVANGLLNLGLVPGDRVATLGDNGPESLELIAGLAVGGFVRCPLYTQNVAEAHVYMLNLVRAKALIVQDRYVDDLLPSLGDASDLNHMVVVGLPPAGSIDYEVLVGSAADDDPAIGTRADDPHIIRFSAGTTGRSKGILHTVGGWAAMGFEFALALPRFKEADAYLVAGPLSHAAGLLVWPMIAAGARQVIMPAFDTGQFFENVQRRRCTLTFLVPTMMQMIVNWPKGGDFDLSSLRAVFYGGAPVSERTLEEAHALWGDIMYQLYGQSECPAVSVLTPDQHGFGRSELRNLRSAGRATPNGFISIRDDEGTPLPDGAVGEVCVRSPARMKGIWEDPDTTRARETSDDFLRTRDVGYLDERGYMFLADRKEDLIVSGGYNVWPAEVENALCAHPAVGEAAVVGVPHPKWGETVVAVVTLRAGECATEDELIDWCRVKVGSVKKPTSVVISADPLPKSPVGKLLRRTVRAQFWSSEEREIRGA
jgi:acyl-CoA synthetase (AMP-forming)/AMP-acid ligase II